MKPSKDSQKKHRPNSNAFFREPAITVTVTTTINEQQEDCLTGCFKALFSCAKKTAG